MKISRTNMRGWYRRMHLHSWKSPLHLPAGQNSCPRQQQDAGNWLKENLTEVWVEEIWPPHSPYCNPFDYFLWGISELMANAKSNNKSKDLIQKIKKVMGFLARDILAKACTSFRSRIEVVFTADGSFIE
jgi:hypothetical protein